MPRVPSSCKDPAGKFLAKIMPDKTINVFGYPLLVSPGPFNKKEHMLITVCVEVLRLVQFNLC